MKALFIFLCIVACLWTVADIIYFIVISKMKDEAEQDIEKARGIERGNISQAAHLNSKQQSLAKEGERLAAAENQIERKWADLEKARKEYAENLAALKKKEKVSIEWYEKLSKWDASLLTAQREFDEMLAKDREKMSVSADQTVEAIKDVKKVVSKAKTSKK